MRRGSADLKRPRESGFAMLFVFVMAAAIAIGLYMEIPRVAFESQRQKEQMLIDRGGQYQRAIQLFYRKYRTYPQNLDDLETTRNIRFLRRRYKDPMTGKDEWRLIHVGPGGVLTDSLVQPANPLGDKSKGATADNSQPGTDPNSGVNMAGRRPSDRTPGMGPEQPGVPTDPNAPQYPQPQYPPQPGQPPDPSQPGQPGQPADPSQPGQPGQPQIPGQPGYPPQPGQPTQPQYPGQPGQPQYPGQPPYPGQPGQPQYPGQPGQPAYPQPQYPGQPGQPAYPGQPPYPGQPGQPTYPGQPPYPGQPAYPGQPPYPGQPGQPAYPGQPQYPGQPNPYGTVPPGRPNTPGQQYPYPTTPGQSPGSPGQQNAGINIIQNLLTTPRQPPSTLAGSGFSGGGAGLAGVASTAKGEGIHLINDRSKYQEWEFIYDLKNDKSSAGLQQQQQQLLQQQNQLRQNQTIPTQNQPIPTRRPGGN